MTASTVSGPKRKRDAGTSPTNIGPKRARVCSASNDTPPISNDDSALSKLMTPEELAAIRERIKQRQKEANMTPKLFFDLDRLRKSLSLAPGAKWMSDLSPDLDLKSLLSFEQPVVFPFDVRELVLRASLGGQYMPSWCKLLRFKFVTKVAVVIVEGAAETEWHAYTDRLPHLQCMFPELPATVLSPGAMSTTFAEELLRIPYSMSYIKILNRDFEIPDEKPDVHKAPESEEILRLLSEKSTDPVARHALSKDGVITWLDVPNHVDVFPRTHLLVSGPDMARDHFPLPFNVDPKFADEFVPSSSTGYKPVSDSSPMFAVDCEMCLTSRGALELTYVALVDESLQCLLKTFVKPEANIVDYLTKYSGVTKEKLANVSTRLTDVQRQLQEILPKDAILVGHGLNGDLNAMRIFHPYVIDTSVVFNLVGVRGKKSKLRDLAKILLGKSIQEFNNSMEGHDAVEDATATMELTLLKLRNHPSFGNLNEPSNLWPVASSEAFVNWYSGVVQKQKSSHTPTLVTPNQTITPESVQIAAAIKPLPDIVPKNDVKNVPRKVIPEKQSEESMPLRNAFLRRQQASAYDGYKDVFRLLKTERQRTGAVVDHEDLVEHFAKSPATVITRPTDKGIVRGAVEATKDHFLVYARLHRFARYVNDSEDRKKEALSKLDRRLKRIHDALPKKSLMMVLFSGRKIPEEDHEDINTGDKYLNGLIFAGIK